MNFTKEQRRAIESQSKQILAVACAGSGKTTVLTQKVKNMLGDDKDVYVITFTNKATDELKHRLGTLGYDAHISTIHKLAFQMIKKYQSRSSYNNYKFLLQKEINDILFKLMREHKLYIDYKKLFALQRGSSKDDDEEDEELEITYMDKLKFKKLMVLYDEYKVKHELYDVAQILDVAIAIMKELNIYVHCDALFVDEFQDVSPTDYEFISRFMCNKFYVGDPNQSIYGFRGADVTIINKLLNERQFENIEIDTNFRCRENIIAYSNQFATRKLDIKHIKQKGVVSEHTFKSLSDANLIADIKKLHNKGYTILVRWNRNAKYLKKVLGENADVMTIHKSKGLEFPKVCVIMDSSLVEQDIAEERRVLYVGATRAEDELVVYIEQDLYWQIKDIKEGIEYDLANQIED